MIDWVSENWVLVLLGAMVALVALWWLLGSSKQVDASTPAERVTAPDRNVSPIVAGPAVAPIEVPPVVIEPEPEALVEPFSPAPAGPADELTRMKGVGPKVAALLNSLGVARYDQIANWSDADIARVDAQLGAFKGRAVRDQWVEQARLLGAGDTAGYEAKFGKLG